MGFGGTGSMKGLKVQREEKRLSKGCQDKHLRYGFNGELEIQRLQGLLYFQ